MEIVHISAEGSESRWFGGEMWGGGGDGVMVPEIPKRPG